MSFVPFDTTSFSLKKVAFGYFRVMKWLIFVYSISSPEKVLSKSRREAPSMFLLSAL